MTAAVAVACAAMTAAGMFLTVVMMIALNIGIEGKITADQSVNCRIRISGNSTEEPDSRLCKGHLRAAADASANQNVGIQGKQKSSQSTVAAAVGVYHLGGKNFTVLYIVNFELPGMAEMLKDLTVFVG